MLLSNWEAESLAPRPDGAIERGPTPILVPGTANAEDASVNIDALSNGGEEGRGLFRGWWEVCNGACTVVIAPSFWSGSLEGEVVLEAGEGGSAENVIEPPLPTAPLPVPVEDCRKCGARAGAAGAWAMCATPAGGKSTLNTVVGLVLAARL